jgi:transcriptional regulator with PAS, ATPase and Fis domain
MSTVLWEGVAPKGPLEEALKVAGFTLSSTEARVAVMRGASTTVPSPKHALPWVWLCSQPVPLEAQGRAVQRGAVDVVCERERGWVERLLARLSEAQVSFPELTAPEGFVARADSTKKLLRALWQAAHTSMPVLLTGETGTGKELAARLIHRWSSRRDATFVPINCAAIPNEMMEGELFGSAKGAFSGSVRDYAGLLAAAEGGTVFLDEIDDTPFSLQVKLLRVLEDRVISRLGENQWREVNFRTIAATNRNLRGLIEAGTFGDDLYERLATVEIHMPPLRERPEDVPELVMQWVERFYREDRAPGRRSRVKELTPDALEVLRRWSWPGNVRELRNVIYGALVQKRAGNTLLMSDLPPRLWAKEEKPVDDALDARLRTGAFNLRKEIEALERGALQSALRLSAGNASQAAKLLGEVGRGSARDPGDTVRTMMKRLL